MRVKDIAVVGLAVRFPGASTPDEYWTNISTGRECIERLPGASNGKPNHVPFAAFPRDIELFDASFFGMTPHEAEILDPQHRFLLECAWEAFENAGYDPTSYSGRVGVYAGCALNTYLLCNLMTRPEYLEDNRLFPLILGSNPDFLATRISYKLNLRGPSHTVQSACSTSLVAVHLACRSLRMEECEMALAGGVALNLKLRDGYTYVDSSIFSADGTCRTFDAEATGTVFGNGAGLVLLKPLDAAIQDGDSVYAVIRGSAVNNDGALKVGYTAPGMEGQTEVIAEALRNADVHPETISYVEAHGTGTPLGDPIEIAALTRAYRRSTKRSEYCAIGSVKTNIGHLDAAAGVAGFIKTVLALRHRKIPPTLHFRRPNPQIDFSSTPFHVSTALMEWRKVGSPRRAGVSAFGVGGTNAHVVLEEAPELHPAPNLRPWQLIRLSARSEAALETVARNLGAWLDEASEINLADIAHTLGAGRRTQEFRRALVCQDSADLRQQLFEPRGGQEKRTRREERSDRPVVFLFPGPEALVVQTARGLYEREEIFQEWIDLCSERLKEETGTDIRKLLYPKEGEESQADCLLHRTEFTQPALFMVEYALARLWMHWGVQPAAMIGHGVGEFVAASLAGIFTLEDALRLVAARARMVQDLPSDTTLFVYLDEATVKSLLERYPSLSLAAVNSSGQCVLSGGEQAIEQVERRLEEGGIQFRRQNLQHGFQSPRMAQVLEPLRRLCNAIPRNLPKTSLISGVDGQWMSGAQATDPEYWAHHMCRTVRLADGIDTAASRYQIFLEVGPGDMLSRLIRRRADRASRNLDAFPSLESARPPGESLMYAAGDLWLHGVPVQIRPSGSSDRRMRIALPTYPFERVRHWIEPKIQSVMPNLDAPAEPITSQPASAATTHVRPTLPQPFSEPAGATEHRLAALWQETLGVAPIGAHDNFFDLGGDSLIAIDLIERLKKEFSLDLSPVDLYEKLTIHQLADFLDGLRTDRTKEAPRNHRQPADIQGARLVQSTLRSRAKARTTSTD